MTTVSIKDSECYVDMMAYKDTNRHTCALNYTAYKMYTRDGLDYMGGRGGTGTTVRTKSMMGSVENLK